MLQTLGDSGNMSSENLRMRKAVEEVAPEKTDVDTATVESTRAKAASNTCSRRTEGDFIIALGLAFVSFLFSNSSLFTPEPIELIIDDYLVIKKNIAVSRFRDHNWMYLLTSDYWGDPMQVSAIKSYRPVTIASYRLQNMLFDREVSPFEHRVTSMFLHMLVVILFYYLALIIFKRRRNVSILSTLFFALHPIHSECIAYIAARAEILAAIFFLSALLAYYELIKRDELVIRVANMSTDVPRQQAINEDSPSPDFGGAVTKTARVFCCVGYTARFFYKQVEKLFRSTFALFWFTVFCTAMACLSKEQGITVAGIAMAADAFIYKRYNIVSFIKFVLTGCARNRRWGFRVIVLGIVTLVLAFLRFQMNGNKRKAQFTPSDNPASFAEDFSTRFMTFSYIAFYHFYLLVWPFPLAVDYTFETIPLLESPLTDYRTLFVMFFHFMLFVGIVVSLFATASVRAKIGADRLQAIQWSFWLMILPYVPAANIFVHTGFVIAERLMYMPSIGYCILLATFFDPFLFEDDKKKSSKALDPTKPVTCTEQIPMDDITHKQAFWRIFVAVIFVSWGIKLYTRTLDWNTNLRIWQTGTETFPNNAKCWNGFGEHVATKHLEDIYGDPAEMWRKSGKLSPEGFNGWHNLVYYLTLQKRWDEIYEPCYKALEIGPRIIHGEEVYYAVHEAHQAWNEKLWFMSQLYNTYKKQGKMEEAEKVILELAIPAIPLTQRGAPHRITIFGDIKDYKNNGLKLLEDGQTYELDFDIRELQEEAEHQRMQKPPRPPNIPGMKDYKPGDGRDSRDKEGEFFKRRDVPTPRERDPRDRFNDQVRNEKMRDPRNDPRNDPRGDPRDVRNMDPRDLRNMDPRAQEKYDRRKMEDPRNQPPPGGIPPPPRRP